MKKYEFMYIVKSNLEQDATKAIITDLNSLIENNGSKVLECKEMGLKDLAYEIQKSKKGYYVWLLIEATAECVAELDRVARLNENVIRHIIVNWEE